MKTTFLFLTLSIIVSCMHERNFEYLPRGFFTINVSIRNLSHLKEPVQFESYYNYGRYVQSFGFSKTDSLMRISFPKVRIEKGVLEDYYCEIYIRDIDGTLLALVHECEQPMPMPSKVKLYTNISSTEFESFFGKSAFEYLPLDYDTIFIDLGIDVRSSAFYDSIRFE